MQFHFIFPIKRKVIKLHTEWDGTSEAAAYCTYDELNTNSYDYMRMGCI